MTTARAIAESLARDFVAAQLLGEAVPVLVALDAVGQLPSPELERLPRVVVRPATTAGLVRAEAVETAIEISCSVQPDALDGGNALASERDYYGVWHCMDSAALESLVDAVLAAIDASAPGAVLSDESIEWETDTAPRQFATITATFQQISTF